ncbi:MAG: hypothetical protein AB4080_06020 [Trichodesmium sp.]
MLSQTWKAEHDKRKLPVQKSEVLIGKALSILLLVTYFRHPALGFRDLQIKISYKLSVRSFYQVQSD